jgi:hypothetical protein
MECGTGKHNFPPVGKKRWAPLRPMWVASLPSEKPYPAERNAFEELENFFKRPGKSSARKILRPEKSIGPDRKKPRSCLNIPPPFSSPEIPAGANRPHGLGSPRLKKKTNHTPLKVISPPHCGTVARCLKGRAGFGVQKYENSENPGMPQDFKTNAR